VARSSIGRKLSFTRRKKEAAEGAAAGEPVEKPVSTLTRVLSFGRTKKKPVEDGATEAGQPPPAPEVKKESMGATLVRKLSFGKKKPPPQ
jgi:hypothetical protein